MQLVCPLILDDACSGNTARKQKNNVGTEISKIARFGAKMALGEMQDKMQDNPCPKSRIIVRSCGHE